MAGRDRQVWSTPPRTANAVAVSPLRDNLLPQKNLRGRFTGGYQFASMPCEEFVLGLQHNECHLDAS
jgi:hypothetical protein